MANMAEMHDATEEYLETILQLEEEGIVPIRARLVERLGVSAPAVSEHVNRLVDGGYTELMDDRSLRLTAKGRAVFHEMAGQHAGWVVDAFSGLSDKEVATLHKLLGKVKEQEHARLQRGEVRQ